MSGNRSTSSATTAEGISIGNASEVLDALIRHVGDCVHIVDLDGRIVRWNASCETVYGWPAKDVLGQVLPIVSTARRRRVIQDIRLLAGAGHVTERTGVVERPDGSTLRVHMSVIPIHDVDGDPCAVAVISQEVLHDERLERQRDDLIAYVGRRLTGPLNTIANAAALLARSDGTEDPVGRRKLAMAVHARARDAQRFVEDLLTTTLASEGRLTLDREPVDLGELVSAVVAESGDVAGRVIIEFDPLVEPVLADRERLRRVFRELVSGVMRICGERADIRISIVGRDDSIEVSLKTCGVPVATIEEVLGDDGADARVTARLVAGIVQAHGGEMTVASDADESRCVVSLPAGPVVGPREEPPW